MCNRFVGAIYSWEEMANFNNLQLLTPTNQMPVVTIPGVSELAAPHIHMIGRKLVYFPCAL